MFRLPGQWLHLLPDEPELSAARIRDHVERVVGKHDDMAQVRALMRDRLKEGLEVAGAGQAESMFICRQLTPKVPMSAVMTVFSPSELRIAPAVGTSPEAVIDMLRRALERKGEPGIEDAVELELPDSRALRMHRVDRRPVAEQAPSIKQSFLIVDYWVARPGTKEVLLVNMFSPLGDIPNVMLSFFDSIVRLSRFEPLDAPAPA